jgi:predicted aspartyl protease
MAYFTRQVAPNGALIVNAVIGVSQARRNALVQAGQPVANAVPIQALIDTGASCTMVDPTVLQQLNLTATGSSSVITPTTGTQPAVADQYDVSIMIPGALATSPALIHQTIAVLEAVLAPQGFHALIGRDILKGCLLTYDGQSGLFSLSY